MAIEALVNFGKVFRQAPRHDLESLLYVILYLCTYTTGPGKLRKESEIPATMTIPLARWFKKDYVKEIGRSKAGHMMMSEDAIIPKFDPYWSDFVPFVRELIGTCFASSPSNPNHLTHANMLAILDRALATVQDDNCVPSTSSPATDGAKRPRLEGDSGVPSAKKGKRATSSRKS
jgi:hypothetical protein